MQLLPNTGHLREGLQLAAVMLLTTDVLMDLLMGLWALARQVGEYARGARMIWRRKADGSVVIGVTVRQAAVASVGVVWATGRVTSSLLALVAGESEQWHLMLLGAAFVIVVLDTLVEASKVVGEAIGRHLV